VQDLGSKNGTFVNGVHVGKALLLPGDRLTVGRTPLFVRYQRHPQVESEQDSLKMTGTPGQ
jgi:pSer/pThr/pTyr-binding forkhead associated (FHA) protein